MSNFTSNLRLKFWWWALETIFHRFYSEGFENKIFTRPTLYPLQTELKFAKKSKLLKAAFDLILQYGTPHNYQ
jgi:hypothetical protein